MVQDSQRPPAPDGRSQEPGPPQAGPVSLPRRGFILSSPGAVPERGPAVGPSATAISPAPPRSTSALELTARLGGDGLLVATALVSLVFSVVQWATPNVIGIDGYYHIRLAAILRDQGWRMVLPLDFPWLPTTILNPAEFTDAHLLYHLLLVPFSLLDLRLGAKLAAVIFASLALLAAYQLMARHGVRYSLIWLMVLLASAWPSLFRLSMTRRQSLTLLLLLLALYLAFTQRRRWLVPLGFAFIWLFDGFPLLLGVCGAALIGNWWERRRPDWGLVLYPALGIALGTVIHPYFPKNVIFSYLHVLPKILQLLGLGTGDVVIQVGIEWYPYSRDFLWEANWLALVLVPVGFVPIVLDPRPSRLRALDGKVVTLAILAVVFLVMFLRARRWVEAEPTFATLFCAFAWNRAQPDRLAGRLAQLIPAGAQPLAGLAAAAVVAPLLYLSVSATMSDVRSENNYVEYRDASLWLARNTPPGARVFPTDWDDFPELFFWNTHNVYLVGLDPTYMYLHDGPAYLRWRSITRGQVERPSAAIRDEFDCGWVFTDREHRAFLRQAAADPDLVEMFRDGDTVVYAVKGWQPRQSRAAPANTTLNV